MSYGKQVSYILETTIVSDELNITKSFFNHTKKHDVVVDAQDWFAPKFTLND